jgi:hypothetical protein
LGNGKIVSRSTLRAASGLVAVPTLLAIIARFAL